MAHKKEEQEPKPKGPQKPAFDPGKSYPPKPHPQHPRPDPEDPGEEPEEGDDSGGTAPPPNKPQPPLP